MPAIQGPAKVPEPEIQGAMREVLLTPEPDEALGWPPNLRQRPRRRRRRRPLLRGREPMLDDDFPDEDDDTEEVTQ